MTEKATSVLGEKEVKGRKYRIIRPEDGIELSDMVIFQAWGEVLVDFEKSPHLQELYDRVKELLLDSEKNCLRVIYEVVNNAFSVRAIDEVDKFIRQYSVGQPISLEDFVGENTGYCVQAVLAVGVLGERAVQEGLIDGKFVMKVLAGDRGQHLWAEHIFDNDVKTLLDPMQDYFGDLEGHKPIEFQLSIEMMDEVE